MTANIRTLNGKAFEYALLATYADNLESIGVKTEVAQDSAYAFAKECFESVSSEEQSRFLQAADATFGNIALLEPWLTYKGAKSPLSMKLNQDSSGQSGDVRDIVFSRTADKWETGISAKNNNDAVKHSRLSHVLDFGEQWFGSKCSKEYWTAINPVFNFLETAKADGLTWEDLGDAKTDSVYTPLLNAFRDEIMRMCNRCDEIPQSLVHYLIGNKPFYKIIKDDRHNMVVVKAFNLSGKLNCTPKGVTARYTTPKISMPTRIVEFELKRGSDNTLDMILDNGWEISFRLHNASTRVEKSLKFDIRLIGNPPVIFTQYLFQK